MAQKINSRTDLGERSTAASRAILQELRNTGAGVGAGSTATWGSINGDINNQLDLKARFVDFEMFDIFMDN